MYSYVAGSVLLGLTMLVSSLMPSAVSAATSPEQFSATSARAGAARAVPTLTLSGSRSGYATITLQRPSTVTFKGPVSPQIKIVGRGRMVGLLVDRIGSGPDAYVAAMQSNACFEEGCEPAKESTGEFTIASPQDGDGTSPSISLPAGRYNVSLVTDGKPVTATIALEGLRRSIIRRPKVKTMPVFSAIQPTLGGGDAHFVVSGGRSYEFTEPNLVVNSQLSTTFAGGEQHSGSCAIIGEAPPMDYYLPGCPTLNPDDVRINPSATQGTAPDDTTSNRLGGLAIFSGLPTGQTVSIGGYVASAVPLQRTDMLQLAFPMPDRPAR